ncbi:MAG: protein translocase subunit SecD [Patescibacteria group bacterium]
MSDKRKIHTNIVLIIILAFLAGSFVYPKYFNLGVDFLNSKLNLKISHFWEKPFKLGLDLQGGAHLIYQADLSNVAPVDKAGAMEGLRDVIERRVNLFGVSEPVVQVQGDRLVVELAGVLDVSQAIEMIGQTPFLEFREQKSNFDEINAANQIIADGAATGTIEDPFQSASLTGKYLKRAEVGFDQTTYKPLVSIEFNDEGAKLFEEITSRNVGKLLAIYIDGQLISAPVVNEAISGGKAQISGNFTVEEVKELVRNLNAGALPIPITLISQQTVGPILGKISLETSLKAGLYGLLAVIIFMIIFYRFSGILASIVLLIYLLIALAFFKIISVTMTLAGIGGFILSIGMAVDANVLIFSRMREELKQQKGFSVSLEEGFRRAWPAIRDGNLTTLIVAFILFALGTSFIRGFAMTLSVGVLVSMFSALVITKNFMKLFEGGKLENIKWLWK